MRTLIAAFTLALALVAAGALAGAGAVGAAPPVADGNKGLPSGRHDPAEELPLGTEAPAFMLLPINPKQCGVNGMVSLNQYRNRDEAIRPKAYLLTFFASWCEPCKRELPSLQALYVNNAARGLLVIDVSIDTDDESFAALAALIKQNAVTFPVLWDKYAVMGKRYKVSRLPYVILLDANARVVKSMIGYNEEGFKGLVGDIEVLLGGAPVPAAVPHAPGAQPAIQPATQSLVQPAAQPAAPVSPYGPPPDWAKK